MFWGDHGQGLPRGKRWIYDSGTHVPLLLRFPGQIEAGSSREDLVSVLDLPPTMLSVAGVEVPKYMHGRVLIGKDAQAEPKYLFFHRDRMDEAYELMRAVRDHDFKYIRNFEPEKTYAQGIDYMDLMPAMREWRRLHREGKLVGAQHNWFAKPKPIEELYDLAKDPHELVNLAAAPEHQERLRAMREALENWQVEIGDLGLVPEPVLMERMRPGTKRERTETPTIEPAGEIVKIRCSTKGASIAYAIIRDGNPGSWQLYAGPVQLPADAGIRAVACRLGFRDSEYAVKK